MNKKKMDIGLRYVMILLLTTFLLVSLSFGWYVSNKEVNAGGITAESGSADLNISNQGIYHAIVGDKDENNPFPPEMESDTLPGLFFGDRIYYAISVYSTDTVTKDISIDINNIDGGEFFTLAPIEDIVDERTVVGKYHTTNRTYTEAGTPVDTEVSYDLYKSTRPTNLPLNSNGKYFIKEADGINYRHYIYEGQGPNPADKRPYSFNTTDLYKYRLYDVFIGNDDRVNPVYERLTNPDGTSKYREAELKPFIRPDGLKPTIPSVDIYDFLSWTPTKDTTVPANSRDVITFKFEIQLDISSLSGTGINIASLSNKDLVFNNILVTSQNSKKAVNA